MSKGINLNPSEQFLDMLVAKIAGVAHENNRFYCQSLGDFSQPSWENAPAWQVQSCISGVTFLLNNPDAAPGDSHRNWLADKEAEGWAYGEVKDPEAKTHPCMVPFDELPQEQQTKDWLFVGIVRTLQQVL